MIRIVAILLFSFGFVLQSQAQESWYDKGKKEKDPHRKVEYFTKALKEKEDNWTYYRRGWAYMDMKNYQMAILDFRGALQATGSLEKKWVYNGLAWAYYDIEDNIAAKGFAKKGIEEDPKNYSAYDVLGWIAISEKKYDEAILHFGKYITFNGKSHVGYNDRSYAYALKGEYAKALADCNEGLKIKPTHERMNVRKGLALVKLGKTDEGVAVLKDKVDFKKDDPISLSNLGRLFYEAGDYESAVEFHSKGITLYEEKIAIDPKFVTVYKTDVYNIYMNRGDAYEAQKKWQNALQNYKRATLIDPKNHRAWLEMGETHTFQDNYKEAVQSYEKAFSVNPNLKTGWTNLGYCYDHLGLNDKAISAYTRGIKANPNDGLLYNNRGYAYLEKGLMAKAKADLDKAIAVDPKLVMSHVSLGEYYFANKQWDEAIKKFDACVAMEGGSVSAYQVAYYTRGRCWHAKKEYGKAIMDYNLSITYDGTHIPSWEWLGIAHFDKKENCDAYKKFKKAMKLDQNNRIKVAKQSPRYLAKLTGNPCK